MGIRTKYLARGDYLNVVDQGRRKGRVRGRTSLFLEFQVEVLYLLQHRMIWLVRIYGEVGSLTSGIFGARVHNSWG